MGGFFWSCETGQNPLLSKTLKWVQEGYRKITVSTKHGHIMGFLFWFLWVTDLLICLLALIGKGFRESYGASNINVWFTVLLLGCTLAGLLLRLVLKNELFALIVAALPLVILLIWYFLDSR